ncbi:MAG: hypothetical protein IJH40_03020 [Ruminococcus sp.]|uniref:hypothetical protein n=1 Tax=Ruminococcus sp. TaxID=41978 RepID=UPI002873EDDC|nr:hypothetical protein [Ruminococcus sp.]MBQ3284589.1 hypothetical protein [Ruminococcus sp.]
MNDKFEKTLKELIPYIIIIGILYLLLPLFMGKDAGFATYFIQLGLFPLTAIGCGVFYKIKKKRNNIWLCLIAPIFYAIAALLYGMWRDSWYTVLIYIVAYFLCGYLGLILGDILPINKKGESIRSLIKKTSNPPRRVNVEEEPAAPDNFVAKDPEKDVDLDTSTTEDDIEAILQSIHNRKQ